MRRILFSLWLFAAPCAALAQFPSAVQPGARVRIWLPEPARQEQGPARRQLLRGTVESVDGGVLRLMVPGTSGSLAIPRGSVRRIDVSHGISRPESMIGGAVGGAIAGAVSFATGGPHYRTDWRAAGVGASWGAGIGAVLGLLFPHESWHRIRL
jgi:hypothetical protein